MEFVPNTKHSHSLVYNGYIFMKTKKNLNGPIRWVCQNMRKKSAVPCTISDKHSSADAIFKLR